jgi:hypothetical protein
MPDVIIELHDGDADIETTSQGGDVGVFIVRWDGIANDYGYAADTFDCADGLEEPDRTRIRDTILEIWPEVADQDS